MQTVTIASVPTHGVRQLSVDCRGKREGDWPCHPTKRHCRLIVFWPPRQ